MTDTKDAAITCKRDGSPMLKIAGRWECVAEYLDHCIGGRQVIDVTEHQDTIYYVFSNRHQLPLLCYCCGQPLAVENLAQSREKMHGRRLESMTFETVKLEDGREVVEFGLEFSAKSACSEGTRVTVSSVVAAGLHHPNHCSRQRRTSIPKRGRKRPRRPR